jgi:hypothetical protein
MQSGVREEKNGADLCGYMYGLPMIEVRSVDLRVESPQSIDTVLVDAMCCSLPGIEYIIDILSSIE